MQKQDAQIAPADLAPEEDAAATAADGDFAETDAKGQVVLRGRRVGGLLDGDVQRLQAGKVHQVYPYRAGKLQGEVLTYSAAGQEAGQIVERSSFVDDVLDGPLETFDEHGRLLQHAPYRRGLLEGEMRICEAGRLVCKQNFIAGKQEGVMVLYNDQGRPSCEFHFAAGKKHGRAEYFGAGGNLLRREHYQQDVLHGECREFYENGAVREQGSYELGKKHGEWLQFHPNGKLAKRMVFDNDQPQGAGESFDDKGRRLPTAPPPPPAKQGGK